MPGPQRSAGSDNRPGPVYVQNRTGVRVYVHVPGLLRPHLELSGVAVNRSIHFLAGITGTGRGQIRFTAANTGNTTLAAAA